MSLLVKGARIIDPKNNLDKVCDLLVEKDKIARIEAEISAEGAKILEAGGRILVPGLIDLHAHLRQPGREDEETLRSGSEAAARGGFTAVAAMANTDPVTDNQGAVECIPDDDAVEVVCRVDAHGAAPLPVGPIPLTFRGLVQAVKAYETLTVAAAVSRRRDLAVQALANHPLVGDLDVIEPLVDEMLAAHDLNYEL